MNLPNILTLARIGMSVIFVIALSITWPYAFVAGFILFLTASLTDFLDGHLARKHNQITDFGKLMDPLADKILVSSAMVLLAVGHGLPAPSVLPVCAPLPAWFVILILLREFLVTGVRMLALGNRIVIAADFWGKFKTVVQIVLVCLILLPAGILELGWNNLAAWPLWLWARHLAFALTLVSTILSGVLYLRTFLKQGALVIRA